MDDVLTTDDPLYEKLYDVRQEAEHIGNYVGIETMPDIHALRAQAPVHKGKLREILNLPHHNRHPLMDGRQHWTVLSYEACETVFRDPKTFSNGICHQPNPGEDLMLSILEMDPPMHRSYRRAIQPKFLMPEAIGWWREFTIDDIVDRLIGRLADRDRADLNIELCARVPVYTITTAIGLEGDDALRFRHAHLNSTQFTRNVSMEERIKNARIVDELLHGLIEDRRKERTQDLISFLLDAKLRFPGEEPRPMTEREMTNMAKIVMVAGGGTSWRQMGITLFALLTHRDQMDEVLANRDLLDDAIEESLRWNPTAPYFYREVMADTELCGHTLKQGDVVEIGIGPANRDPSRWENPDEFNIHRPQLTNMAFGLGTHRCLGMNVAKVEITRAINAIFDAFPDIRLDTDAPMPEISGGFEQRGPTAVPVILR